MSWCLVKYKIISFAAGESWTNFFLWGNYLLCSLLLSFEAVGTAVKTTCCMGIFANVISISNVQGGFAKITAVSIARIPVSLDVAELQIISLVTRKSLLHCFLGLGSLRFLPFEASRAAVKITVCIGILACIISLPYIRIATAKITSDRKHSIVRSSHSCSRPKYKLISFVTSHSLTNSNLLLHLLLLLLRLLTLEAIWAAIKITVLVRVFTCIISLPHILISPANIASNRHNAIIRSPSSWCRPKHKLISSITCYSLTN